MPLDGRDPLAEFNRRIESIQRRVRHLFAWGMIGWTLVAIESGWIIYLYLSR